MVWDFVSVMYGFCVEEGMCQYANDDGAQCFMLGAVGYGWCCAR